LRRGVLSAVHDQLPLLQPLGFRHLQRSLHLDHVLPVLRVAVPFDSDYVGFVLVRGPRGVLVRSADRSRLLQLLFGHHHLISLFLGDAFSRWAVGFVS
jgi:hypothetical protein